MAGAREARGHGRQGRLKEGRAFPRNFCWRQGSENGRWDVELARGRREAMRRSTPVDHVILWILGTNGRRWIQPDGTASEMGWASQTVI